MSLQAYNSATDTLTPIAENDYKDSLEKISALPTASASLLNMCYLLTANQGSYVKGGIYQCQSNGSGGYTWILINGSGVPVDTVEDGNMNAVTSNAVSDKFDTLGTASQKNFTPYVSPDNTDVPLSSSVYSAITSAVYGAYHPSGSKTIAELTSDLLVLANIGNVYKITEDGVTTDLFIGGAGQTIHTGDNAVVVYGGSPNTFLFDLQSGSIDLTPYQTKALGSAVEGATTVEGALSALSSGKVSTAIVPTDASASNKLVATNAIYKTLNRSWNAVGNRFIKLSNAYPTLGLRTNNYVVSCRNGETYLLLCGTTDGGYTVAPEVYLLYGGTGKLTTNGFYYDSTTNEIAFMTQGYNNVSVTQISGEVKNIILSEISETNPLSNPVAITPQKLVTASDFNYKSGTRTGISISANSINEFVVTFNTPMPDTDYVTTVNTDGVEGGLFASIWNKNTTGFSVTIYNANSVDVSNESFKWQAYKIPH